MEQYRLIVSENYHRDIKTEPAKADSFLYWKIHI